MSATPPFDLQKAQRWFAVEANNRGWDLVELPQRSPAEVEEMIHVAHAALWHWRAAGAAINELRALELLTTAYCAAGRAEPAGHFSQQTLAQLSLTPDHTPFDAVCSHAGAAWASQLQGDAAGTEQQRRLARDLLPALAADEDRELVQKIYPTVLRS